MGGRKKFTRDCFIEKAKSKHGDRYDYSKVDYKSSQTKVCVVCPEHGEFYPIPNNHLRGSGCMECGLIRTINFNTKSLNDIIIEFVEKHGNKYDYSKVDYKGAFAKISIVCPIHGEFQQRAHYHLRGSGCPKCIGRGLLSREWIDRFVQIHGDEYNYSKFIYSGKKKKSCIICPKHGEFWQTADMHYHNKAGCPKCKTSKIELCVIDILEKNGIRYRYNKREYKWLVNPKTGRKLQLDFYLPDYNIAIECQGEQHFTRYKFEKTDEMLIKRKKRDKIKRQLCEENDVRLYYINYDDNIENKLKEILESYVNIK